MPEEIEIEELIERDSVLLLWTQGLVEYYESEISKHEMNPHNNDVIQRALINYITLLKDGAVKQYETGQEVIEEAKKTRKIN